MTPCPALQCADNGSKRVSAVTASHHIHAEGYLRQVSWRTHNGYVGQPVIVVNAQPTTDDNVLNVKAFLADGLDKAYHDVCCVPEYADLHPARSTSWSECDSPCRILLKIHCKQMQVKRHMLSLMRTHSKSWFVLLIQ